MPSAQTVDKRVHSCHEVVAVLTTLPYRQRVSLLLRLHHKQSYAEIAAAIHCSENEARESAYEGVRTLRVRLGDRLRGGIVTLEATDA